MKDPVSFEDILMNDMKKISTRNMSQIEYGFNLHFYDLYWDYFI